MSRCAVDFVTVGDANALADVSAAFVTERVTATPTISLTLPTGATPLGLYRRLRDAHAAGNFTLDAATVFMLDEYLDLPDYPRASFAAYLRAHLGAVIFNDSTVVELMAPLDDPNLPERYDAALDAVGGLDLAIVGVGRNGHVGFNEPGSSGDARTHVVALSATTLEANFPDTTARPTTALTIGLRDLRAARSILMIVAGDDKHHVATALARGVVDPLLPATQLLGHEDLTIVMAAHLVR